MQLTLPKWYDLHTHLRQDSLMAPIIASQLNMGCCGVLAMPNTKPPAAKVLKSDDLDYWSVEEYLDQIRQSGGDAFKDIIVPLYLTKDTTPEMIEQGAKSGLLRAAKYYPPHGTTGSDFSQPISDFLGAGVFDAMANNNVILCVHGEEHGMKGEDYLSRTGSAEEYFYRERLPRVIDKHPDLKVVGEHVTTKVAVDFILEAGSNIAASVTPQHLLYTVGHLVQGLKYHLYCMPLVKFADDREAIRKAVVSPDNKKFFAGTDSAAHTKKATECGCAAGCFTGNIAPQLYAQAFEEAGADLSKDKGQEAFRKFLCTIGPSFYNLPASGETFTLVKEEQKVEYTQTPDGDITPLPIGLGSDTIPWAIKS